jgi:Domain of unknown function (DUF4124)
MAHHNPPSKLSLYVLTLALGFLVVGAYAQVYKHIDEKGNVTFSDKKSPAAATVDISGINISKSVETSIRPDAVVPEPTQHDKPTYKILVISAPKDGSIIPNGLVPLTVSTDIRPKLQEAHILQLLVDGNIHSESQSGSLTLSSVNRGKHTLQVKIVDLNKKTVKQSPTSTIFVYWPGGN